MDSNDKQNLQPSISTSFKFDPFGDEDAENSDTQGKLPLSLAERGVIYSTPALHIQEHSSRPIIGEADNQSFTGIESIGIGAPTDNVPGGSYRRSSSASTSSSFSMIDLKAALPLTSLTPVISYSSSPPRAPFFATSRQHSPVSGIHTTSPMALSNSAGLVGVPAYFPQSVSTPVASAAQPAHNHSSSMSSTQSVLSSYTHSSTSSHPPSKQPSTLSIRTSSLSQPSVQTVTPPALPPVAGFRVPATGDKRMASFPLLEMCGPAFADCDGNPLYVCSAILGNAVHPGKAGPHLTPPARISFGGKEIKHEGRYDLLPITAEMKWISASNGKLPQDYVPVQAGYEESGEQLFHALAKIRGYWVPGKSGLHLKGANFPFANREVSLTDGYRILCWTNRMSQRAVAVTYP